MSQDRAVKPWDLFNKNMERALPILQEKRLEMCKTCPRYVRFTHQCKECGCMMDAKVKLLDATCPLNKWNKLTNQIPIDREMTESELKEWQENNEIN